MTWAEFKALVEKMGMKDSDEIQYIDVSWPGIDTFEVTRDEDNTDQVRIA